MAEQRGASTCGFPDKVIALWTCNPGYITTYFFCQTPAIYVQPGNIHWRVMRAPEQISKYTGRSNSEEMQGLTRNKKLRVLGVKALAYCRSLKGLLPCLLPLTFSNLLH